MLLVGCAPRQQFLTGQHAAIGKLEATNGNAVEDILRVKAFDVDLVTIAQVEQQGAFAQLDVVFDDARAKAQGVGAGGGEVVIKGVYTIAPVVDVGVVARAAIKCVVVLAAYQDVIAAIADELIHPTTAVQVVIALDFNRRVRVVAIIPVHHVIVRATK